jgi:hypothetical protein
MSVPLHSISQAGYDVRNSRNQQGFVRKVNFCGNGDICAKAAATGFAAKVEAGCGFSGGLPQ